MHINVHYAIGVVVASISHYFLNLNLIEYSLIIFCAFIIDFDIVFSKYDKDNNHRNLITHSIWPGSVMLLVGLILLYPLIVICGAVLIIHILIDTFDWGINLFYTGKTIGVRLLISREEEKNIKEILSNYKVGHSFFVFRYYGSKGFVSVEVIVFVLMMIANIFLAVEFWYLVLPYFFFFGFHFYEYKKLKNIENS